MRNFYKSIFNKLNSLIDTTDIISLEKIAQSLKLLKKKK